MNQRVVGDNGFSGGRDAAAGNGSFLREGAKEGEDNPWQM